MFYVIPSFRLHGRFPVCGGAVTRMITLHGINGVTGHRRRGERSAERVLLMRLHPHTPQQPRHEPVFLRFFCCFFILTLALGVHRNEHGTCGRSLWCMDGQYIYNIVCTALSRRLRAAFARFRAPSRTFVDDEG